MKIKFVSVALSLHLVLFAFDAQADPYSNLVIFGGSLADTGNFPALTGDLPPPYYMNRMSNGPVTTDVVAAEFGFDASPSLYLIGPPVANNYATFGALASQEGLLDLKSQMDAYFSTTNNLADPDALYFVLIGGNDVFAATFEPDDEKSEQIIRDAVVGTEAALERLVNAGAKTVLAANFFDLGIVPAARINGLVEKASDLSNLFNKLTEQMFRRVQGRLEFQLIRWDFNRIIETLLVNTERLGFTNSTDACIDFLASGECDFETYAFFSQFLPTERIHSLLAADMVATIMESNAIRAGVIHEDSRYKTRKYRSRLNLRSRLIER